MRKFIVLLLTVSILFAASSISIAAWKPLDPEEPLTPPEKSGWGLDVAVTSSSQEVVDFCYLVASLSKGRVRAEVAGYTAMGKPLIMLVMGNPAPNDRAEKERRGLSSVFINCNIHSGEVEGKEGALIFAREAALGRHDELLSKITVIMFPNMNADGNDFLGTWRSGADGTGGSQPLGPKLHGTRYNSQGLNINRDFSKLEAAESRVIFRVFNEWNPVLYLDAHATNGTRMRHAQSYAWGLHPNTDKELMEYNRTKFMENVFGPNSFMARIFKDEAPNQLGTRRTAVPYAGSFTGDTARVSPDPLRPTTHVIINADLAGEWDGTGENGNTITWPTYGDLPRHTTNLAALGNRLALLLEAYSYDPYRYRVETQYATIVGAIEAVANDIDNINRIIKAADDRARSWKTTGLPNIDIGLEGGNPARYNPASDDIIGAYGAENGIREIDSFVCSIPINQTGRYSITTANFDMNRHITYRLIERQRFIPVETAKMGALYIFEAGAFEAARLLMRHGIEVHRLTKDVEIPDHYRFNFTTAFLNTFTRARYEGHWINGRTSGYRSYNEIQGNWSHASNRSIALWTPYRLGTINVVVSHDIINKGSYVVSTAQPRGLVAALLLEPRANDGLFYWNYFDHIVNAPNIGERGGPVTPIIKTYSYNAGGTISDNDLEIVSVITPEWPTDQPEDIGQPPESISGKFPAGVKAGHAASYVTNVKEAEEMIKPAGGTTKEDDELYYLNNAAAFANSKLSGVEVKTAVSMPIFRFFVQAEGDVGAITLIGIEGSSFLASKAGDVKIMMLTKTGAELLSIVYDPKDLADGKFIISTAEGYVLKENDPIPDYMVFDVTVALKDGGKFDLAIDALAIGNTLVFIEAVKASTPVKSGSGSGCVSFPLIPIVLLLASAYFVVRKRK